MALVNRGLIILLLCVALPMAAQHLKPDVEVTVDPDTGLPDKYAPFDQQFVLNIPVDSSFTDGDIRTVVVMELKKGSRYAYMNDNRIEGRKAEVLSFTVTKAKYNTLKVLSPPLAPNGDYSFLVQHKSGAVLETLEKINSLIQGGQSGQSLFEELANTRYEFNEPAEDTIRRKVGNPVELARFPYSDYLTYYIQTLETPLNNVARAFTTQVNIDLEKALLDFKAELKTCPICAFVGKCDCKNDFIVDELKLSLTQMLLISCGFEKLTAGEIRSIAMSTSSVDSILSKTAGSAFVVTNKIKASNLKRNLAYFVNLRNLLTESNFISSGITEQCRQDLLGKIDPLIEEMTARQHSVTTSLSAVAHILKGINNSGFVLRSGTRGVFAFYKIYGITASTGDIKTAGGNYIIPEFGLANMVSNQTNGGPTYFLRPYYGINVSFRAINKNIRFKDIRYLGYKKIKSGGTKTRVLMLKGPSIWHHMSASIGVTQNSIATNHPEIDDLTNSTCLMTGLNYRLTRSFRIGAGAVWYKKDNPNPLLSSQITAMPYFSLALDIDIVNMATNITDKLFK